MSSLLCAKSANQEIKCCPGCTTPTRLTTMDSSLLPQTPPCELYEPVNEDVLKELINQRSRLVQAIGFSSKERHQRDLLSCLKAYSAQKVLKRAGGRRVSYDYGKGHSAGRPIAQSFSMQTCDRPIRHALCAGALRDIDAENCHPQIIAQWCKKHGVPCPELDLLNADCKKKRAELMAAAECDYDTAKKLILQVGYGGGCHIKLQGQQKRYVKDEWLHRFSQEVRTIHTALTEHFPKLFQQQQAKYAADDKYKTAEAKHSKAVRSTAALAVQTMESSVLKVMQEYCKQRKLDVRVLAHDGLMVLHKDIPEDFMLSLSAQVKQQTGLHLVFAEKAMQPADWDALEAQYFTPAFIAHEAELAAAAEASKKRKQDELTAAQEALPEYHELLLQGDRGLAKALAVMRGADLKNVGGDKDKSEFYCYEPASQLWLPYTISDVMNKEIVRLKEPLEQLLQYYELQEEQPSKRRRHSTQQEHSDDSATQTAAEKCIAALNTIKTAKGCSAIMAFVYSTVRDVIFKTKLDVNPDILSVANGVVELDKKLLRPRTREDYCSFALSWSYNPAHESIPMVDKVIKAFVLHEKYSSTEHPEQYNDRKLYYKYFRRFLGYCITGHVKEQIMAFLVGVGSNGKGIIGLILRVVLQHLFYQARQELLSDCKPSAAGAASPHLMALRYARVVFVDECPETPINEVTFRELTGGANVSGRCLNQKVERTGFAPTHTMIVNCNDLPGMNMRKNNNKRRARPMCADSFATKDYDSSNPRHVERDDDLEDKLRQIPDACGSYLVECAYEWYQHGLGEEPKCCAELRTSIEEDNDYLTEFIEDCCTVGPQHRCLASDALSNYNTYVRQATAGKVHPVKKGQLHTLMAGKGFHKETATAGGYRGKVVYNGLCIDGEEEPQSEAV